MKIDLSSKKIIVTGASSGIGQEIAKQLIAAGATLAIHYNSNKAGAASLLKENNNSKIYTADLADNAQVIAFFDNVVADFGKIDFVVLNAGIFEPHVVTQDSDTWLATWNRTININLNSVGLLTQLACRHFIKHDIGGIAYISSRAAFKGETEDYLAYAASKGAVVSLARTVARSFGKYNIKAFNIAPGFTKTAMAQNFIDVHGEQPILDELSLNQLTTPADIAPIVTLMAAGLMDHATGSTIDFNGGSYVH